MNQTQLNKIFNLVRRTGDRIIVPDSTSDEIMIMMNLDSYEKLLSLSHSVRDLSESEMMNKIDRDISLWKSHHEDDEMDWERGTLPTPMPWEDDIVDHRGEDRFSSDYLDDDIDDIDEVSLDDVPIGDFEMDSLGGSDMGEEIDIPFGPEDNFKVEDKMESIDPWVEANTPSFEGSSLDDMPDFDFGDIDEEPLHDILEETEEERFYLEPIE